MKKKIFLVVLTIMALACLMAVSVFAAEPDTSGESVTLSDGTVCPVWDKDGDALIWYKSTANTDDGYASYDYIKAQASEVSYVTSWRGYINGAYAYQVATVTITVDGVTYGKDDIVIFNVKDEDVKVTGASDNGKPVNCYSYTFNNSKSLEYAFLRLDTVALQASAFSNSAKLKYVNLEELTELNQIVSQNFTNCRSFFDGQTLDLSKTKLTTLNSGTFNNTPIGELILPETITSLASWSLQGLTKITEFHIPESITYFGDTMFNGCVSLQTITGYKALFERGVIDHIQVNTFMNCSSLTSVDLPDDYLSIGGHAFNGAKKLTGTFKLSDSCTSIGGSAFHSTGFSKIILNPNITVIPAYAFRASQITEIYLPAGITKVENEAFRDMPNKVVIYYTGDTGDALKNVTVDNYNWAITAKDSVYVHASEFDFENREDKNYVVFGVNKCEAFYGGHTWKNENIVKVSNYFDVICVNDKCSVCSIDKLKETISPLFENKGVSAKTFGDDIALVQSYGINKAAISTYKNYVADFDFGILAYANNGGTACQPKPGEDKVVDIVFDNMANDYIEVKLTGVPQDCQDVKLVFCAYVTEGESIYYLDDGETLSSVIGKSYKEIVG